ncbi:MAG: type II toxin-antitoxin system HipA family toxin [Rubrivivax sp.]|nr:type II toxin-antitoxin system HipA family toxin [Rubrivivax sp.]
MQPRPDRLDVYYGSDLVGAVHDSAPLAFEYAPGWLNPSVGLQRMSLAAIPLQPGRHATPEVQAFFENLLPEGELRDYLAAQRKASTLFSLLLEVAGDTAGAFVLVAPGQTPEPPRYEATTWEAIAAFLAKRSASAIDIHEQGARISLAGAQDKTSLAIFDDGVPRLPKGTSPSTHILKPNIRRLAKVWHSAVNETIVMRAAALAGLPTAEVFYEPHAQACVVRRFDRQLRPDGTLARLVQYDLCQLAGTVSDRKYEKEGGPGLAACAELIRRYSAQPAVDLRHLVRWVFFNLYVGNNDSHAKNLSIYSVPGQGVTLTPFYDLMCTRLYPGLSPEFAFAIGGEVRPGEMGAEHLALMASQLGMQPRFLAQQAREMADRVPAAIEQATREIAPSLTPSARTLAERLERFVSSTTKKLAARLAA